MVFFLLLSNNLDSLNNTKYIGNKTKKSEPQTVIIGENSIAIKEEMAVKNLQ